jgi:hypothetical protein
VPSAAATAEGRGPQVTRRAPPGPQPPPHRAANGSAALTVTTPSRHRHPSPTAATQGPRRRLQPEDWRGRGAASRGARGHRPPCIALATTPAARQNRRVLRVAKNTRLLNQSRESPNVPSLSDPPKPPPQTPPGTAPPPRAAGHRAGRSRHPVPSRTVVTSSAPRGAAAEVQPQS